MSLPDRLTPLQWVVLRAFFAAERGFFLSGGGALVGFYLGHRETTDLDLFTTSSEAFDRARIVLPNVVAAFGALAADDPRPRALAEAPGTPPWRPSDPRGQVIVTYAAAPTSTTTIIIISVSVKPALR